MIHRGKPSPTTCLPNGPRTTTQVQKRPWKASKTFWKSSISLSNHLFVFRSTWSSGGYVDDCLSHQRCAGLATLAGYEFWLIPAINASFRNVLNTWTCFLRSSASQAGLKNWLYQDTLGMIAQVANGGHTGSPFHQIFVCDPTAPYYGFGTWDGFFRKPGNGLHPGL